MGGLTYCLMVVIKKVIILNVIQNVSTKQKIFMTMMVMYGRRYALIPQCRKRKQYHPLSYEFCEEKFDTIRNLMRHKKSQHEESINLCWNYASEEWKFGDDECWFSHSKGNVTRGGDSSLACNNCDETFSVKARFVYHMKKQVHADMEELIVGSTMMTR